MRNAAEWLETRLDGVPAELAGALRELVGRVGPAADDPRGVAWALASAALAGLDRVTAGRGGRDAALELLAADAALTYAFEAAVEEGADVLVLAEALGPRGELGRRLARATGSGAPEVAGG